MVQIHGVMQILKSISLLYKMNFTTCYLFHNFIHIYKISSFAHLVFFRKKIHVTGTCFFGIKTHDKKNYVQHVQI